MKVAVCYHGSGEVQIVDLTCQADIDAMLEKIRSSVASVDFEQCGLNDDRDLAASLQQAMRDCHFSSTPALLMGDLLDAKKSLGVRPTKFPNLERVLRKKR
jgi:hypothetical protein